MNAKIEIEKVDNGYIVTDNLCTVTSVNVYQTLEDVLQEVARLDYDKFNIGDRVEIVKRKKDSK